MISLAQETVIPLSEAPHHLPKRRGKKVHKSTLFRWAGKGISGKCLETIKIGGIRCTSLEALQRFTERDQEQASGFHPPAKRSRGRAAQTDRVLSSAELGPATQTLEIEQKGKG